MRWRRQENLERCKMRWPLKEALRQPCYLDVLAFLARAPCDRSAPNMDYNGKVIRQHQT
jgi:hypothetical protein